MNKNDIDQLLSKFYRGETTLDEEQQLLGALSDDSVDALLMKELEGVDSEIEVPADLEQSLSDMIDEWDAQEQQETKVVAVAPSMWRRTSWIAAAASVAIIATVGWWMMRNNSTTTITENNPPMIAKTVKPVQNEVVTPVEPAKASAEQPELQPQRIGKPSPTSRLEVEQLAQVIEKPSAKSVSNSTLAERMKADAKPIVKASAKPGAEPVKQNHEEELSPEDELLAMEALEKFSTTLNKGMDQLNEAGEKIDNINNTIKQYL